MAITYSPYSSKLFASLEFVDKDIRKQLAISQQLLNAVDEIGRLASTESSTERKEELNSIREILVSSIKELANNVEQTGATATEYIATVSAARAR